MNLTEDHFNEFEFIIHLYLDFCQKEKFKKLKQLRQNQSNLPVFKYRQIILDTIKENQITSGFIFLYLNELMFWVDMNIMKF